MILFFSLHLLSRAAGVRAGLPEGRPARQHLGGAEKLSRTLCQPRCSVPPCGTPSSTPFFVVLAWIISSLVVASLIQPLSNKVQSLFRGAFYLPNVTSIIVISLVWIWIFEPDLRLLQLPAEPGGPAHGALAAEPGHRAVEHRPQHRADRAGHRRGALFRGDGLDPARLLRGGRSRRGQRASRSWFTSPSRCSSRPRST